MMNEFFMIIMGIFIGVAFVKIWEGTKGGTSY